MKRLFIALISIALIGAVALFAYAWFFGGYRVARDTTAFSDAIQACAPFSQRAYVPLDDSTREQSVSPGADGLCQVRMQIHGTQYMTCQLNQDQRTVFAAGHRAQLDQVGFLGRPTSITVSTSSDDPYVLLLNSPSCTVE